ncbi:hypothetical protein COV17_00270 [Candidatus Woesearchaeota archaeon CG10_big_fil_rev_8_21_14_0_10_36_11]|nr:MAG: hypothetical protein COV17_00270 [Candidatus Woesearchaeota archaeon CG10_big_fil_rev_8_21_14_0_10_36_11]
MKKVLLILSVVMVIFIVVGCENVPTDETVTVSTDDGNVEVTNDNADVEVDVSDDETTVEIEGPTGSVVVESSGFDGDDWCQDGAEWKYAATTADGAANAQWIMKGLVSSGQFAGLCHVEYTVTSAEGNVKMDYYFSENGESGYYEMDINGQKYVSEWSK